MAIAAFIPIESPGESVALIKSSGIIESFWLEEFLENKLDK